MFALEVPYSYAVLIFNYEKGTPTGTPKCEVTIPYVIHWNVDAQGSPIDRIRAQMIWPILVRMDSFSLAAVNR